MIPNCAATRHVEFTLDGSGPAVLEPPKSSDWPEISLEGGGARRVNIDNVTKEEIAGWKPGESC